MTAQATRKWPLCKMDFMEGDLAFLTNGAQPE